MRDESWTIQLDVIKRVAMSMFSQLTYLGVLLAVFGNQVCLPIPSVVFLIAGGALSAHGKMSAAIVVLLGVLGSLAGDGIWFWVGRKWGPRAMGLLCSLSADPRSCSKNAHEKFRRYGVRALCVAKFLPGLDAVLPPLGGAEGVSFTRFIAFDALGSLLWSGFYVGLGYVFSNELHVAIRWAKQFGNAFGIAIGIPIGLYVAWRGLTLVRMIRQVREHRISVQVLQQKLNKNGKIALIDLASFEAEGDTKTVKAIPGAVSVDPSVLEKHPHITIPDDVKVILYSSSGSDIVSARAAEALKRIGVNKVWVLDGGLKAWRENGLPVSHSLQAPEAVAERLGVNLPELSPTSQMAE
jgi:membrane protein DedA with SNARE-associated domain/rhodanese-related sulfurtransferase